MKKANISFANILIIILVVLNIAMFSIFGLRMITSSPTPSIKKSVPAIQSKGLDTNKINWDEYYPLRQSNSWTYSVSSDEKSFNKTIRVEGEELINGIKTVKLISTDGQIKYIGFDSEGIKEYKSFNEGEYEISKPPFIIFPNIELGESKIYATSSIRYDIDGTEKDRSNEDVQIKLESMKDVEVPVGKFSGCLKFSMIFKWKDESGNYGNDDCFIWFAPGIGKVKESCLVTEYDVETKKEETSIKIEKLISAIINGKKIGR